MKTLDEILEGVTAGGKWELGASNYILWGLRKEMSIGRLDHAKDAAYAAWAARHAPSLVRALDLMITACPLCHGEGMVMPSRDPNYKLPCEHCAKGRAVLAEALKD